MTEGADKWLQYAEIGRNIPGEAAMQLEAFTLSGFAAWIEKTQKTKESMYFIPIVATACNSMWWQTLQGMHTRRPEVSVEQWSRMALVSPFMMSFECALTFHLSKDPWNQLQVPPSDELC